MEKVERVGTVVVGDLLIMTFRELKEWLGMTATVTHHAMRRPWCFVELTWNCDIWDVSPLAVGFAKCCYPDVWDEGEGYGIAQRKAVGDMARRLWDRWVAVA